MMVIDPATCRRWREQPQIFVRECFGVEPDPWQDDVLAAFPKTPRLALIACKGPGKSTVLAWLGWNFTLTRPFPKVAVTSITRDNLRDGLWTEFAKWRERSDLLKERFLWTNNRIFLREAPETWWISARSWSKSATASEQQSALAGLHEDYILFLLDETGEYPEAILPVAEAALSSCIEGHIVQAGNPLRLDGPLYHAATHRDMWKVWEISADPLDPKRTPRIKVDYAQEQIDLYGREHPWVMVNILGKFPPSSFDALIGPDEMAEAMKRSYTEDDIEKSAKVLGIDVARFGDDASVIFKRQGLVAFTPKLYRNLTSIAGAEIVARQWSDWDADAAFIDNSGGFGSGWIDNLEMNGYAPQGVDFSSKPYEPRFYNKRAEMYFEAVDWIKSGGQLPPIPELTQAFTQTMYTFKGNALILEEKAQIKARLGFSPDHADSFVLTFAHPVMPKNGGRRRGGRMRVEYDPMAAYDREYDRVN